MPMRSLPNRLNLASIRGADMIGLLTDARLAEKLTPLA